MPKPEPLTAAELGIENVLEHVRTIYLLEVELRGDEAYFLCPVHDDHKASASVNLKNGWWSCWTCSAGGDIINLGCKVLKMSRMLLEASLSPDDPDSRRAAIIRICEAHKRREEPVKEADEVVDRVQDPDEFDNGPMTYMYARGFTPLTLQKFGIRYVKWTYVKTKRDRIMKLRKCIAIPLHDAEGELVAWCFRATPESFDYQPKYFYTTGRKVSEILFGEHLLDDRRPLVVTEGAIDAMWITQAGFQATAVLGTSNVTPVKIDRISDFSRVVIFGDRDRAGIQFVERLGELLRPHTSVSIARYRRGWKGNDPNELTREQISDAIERATPFHEWRSQAG